MSTFDGFVQEFPDISIDYFRIRPGRPAPQACFLSHVHSDHLMGLESYRSPFIYCSPATRELLLKIEKYPHRMNHVRGILESRKQHYKHLRKVLKTIPLNTPTDVELGLNRFIRVTLLDSNHCAGAVMFLIQGDSNTILYTGDIRSEPWWVDSLVRNPLIIPYARGLKKLDKIYLDTTFASKNETHLRFPTKADGIAELLEKVLRYPLDTVFHLHAWTPGYEDVWIALCNALSSQIHVDDYKLRLYKSLAFKQSTEGEALDQKSADDPRGQKRSPAFALHPCYEGPVFTGFQLGNHHKPGCLTNRQDVRLHSCEHGTDCAALISQKTIFITPILSRTLDGRIVAEIGAGGGAADLTRSHELELSEEDLARFREVCVKVIPSRQTRAAVEEIILTVLLSEQHTLASDALGLANDSDEMQLQDFARNLARFTESTLESNNRVVDDRGRVFAPRNRLSRGLGPTNSLPLRLDFPYSRHSSYEELCHLVQALRPLDIHPCTFEIDSWSEGRSMRTLFGEFCPGNTFAFDKSMRRRKERFLQKTGNERSTANGAHTDLSVPKRKADFGDSSAGKLVGAHRMLGTAAASPTATPTKRARAGNRMSSQFYTMMDSSQDHSEISPDTALAKIRTGFHNRITRSLNGTSPDQRKVNAQTTVSYSVPPDSACATIREGPHDRIAKSPLMRSGSAGTASKARNGPAKLYSPLQWSNHAKSSSVEGTSALPIELSDDDKQVFVTPQEQEAGASEHQKPVSNASVLPEDSSQNATETQITLSDAAFESQISNPAPTRSRDALRRRKQSYVMARDFMRSSDQAEEYGIVSSNAGHQEQDKEL